MTFGSEGRFLYHPYTNSDLPFTIITSNSTTTADQSAAVGRHNMDIITNLHLYSQPLLDPNVAATFLGVKFVVVLMGIYVQYKIRAMLRRDTCLINHVLSAYSVIQMMFWPFMLIFNDILTSFVYPISDVTGSWLCDICVVLICYGRLHILFHTFIVALMRYVFVVHDDRVVKFGKQRAKRIFFWISLIWPMMSTAWLLFQAIYFRKEFSFARTLISKCYGNHHNMFMTEDLLDWKKYCTLEVYEMDGYFEKFSELVQRGFCVGFAVVNLIVLSNVAEGLLYWRVMKRLKRYVNNEHSEKESCS